MTPKELILIYTRTCDKHVDMIEFETELLFPAPTCNPIGCM